MDVQDLCGVCRGGPSPGSQGRTQTRIPRRVTGD